jgi:hypothetical protein
MTEWEQAAFAVGTLILALSTMPMIFTPSTKVPRSASLIRSAVYLVFTVAHCSLGFYWAASVQFFDLLCWLFIAWKRA